MGKVILFIVALIVFGLAIQGSVYFWKWARRKWAKEDAQALIESRRQALLDFQESTQSFEQFINSDRKRLTTK